MHLLSLNDNIPPRERKQLEITAMRQRGEAMAMLKRHLVHLNRSPEDNDDILASTMSLAMFEYRYSPRKSSAVHLQAVKTVIKLTDGPLRTRNKTLARQAIWFECVFASGDTSFFFEPADVMVRAAPLTEFLDRTAALWRDGSNNGLIGGRKPAISLSPSTILYQFLSRDTTTNSQKTIYNDVSETFAQLTCILIYIQTVLDTIHNPHIMYAFKHYIEDTLHTQHIDASAAVINLMWIMLTDTGMRDIDCRARRWHVAALLNAIKYLNQQWQQRLKGWLLSFIAGDSFQAEFRVDAFVFSYHAGERWCPERDGRGGAGS